MGNTFGSVLIARKGRLSAAVGHLRAAVEEMGERAENLDMELRAGPKDRFYVLTGGLVDAAEWDNARALARAFARKSGASAIALMGLDSDVSVLSLTDGERESALAFGEVDGYFEPGDLPNCIEDMWDALFSVQKGRRVLSDLLEVQNMEERGDAFFAERAVQALSEVLKFDCMAACGFPEESEAEVVWRSADAEGGARGGMVPDGEPPRFAARNGSPINPCGVSVHSAGGRGRGIEATFLARGFDAARCEIPDVGLHVMWGEHGAHRLRLTAPAHRVSTAEGEGWSASFPDVEILPGSRRPERYLFDSPSYFLRFPVYGAAFAPKAIIPPSRPGIEIELSDGRVGLLRGKSALVGDALQPIPYFDVWIAPTDNPEGGVWMDVSLMRENEPIVGNAEWAAGGTPPRA